MALHKLTFTEYWQNFWVNKVMSLILSGMHSSKIHGLTLHSNQKHKESEKNSNSNIPEDGNNQTYRIYAASYKLQLMCLSVA
jgi:hypothetical protein